MLLDAQSEWGGECTGQPCLCTTAAMGLQQQSEGQHIAGSAHGSGQVSIRDNMLLGKHVYGQDK